MAEEKVEPPNEKIGWKEIPTARERSDYDDNTPFYEIRAYKNVFETMILVTFSFFDGEIILKALLVADDLDKIPDRVYFLKLESGVWVKSVANGKCVMHLESEEEKTPVILKIIISVQTEKGYQTRILTRKT